jgi:Domain of unknown function (DUF929)
VAQSTQQKPAGRAPGPNGRPTGKPLTKKQRRNQAAARSVSINARPPWQSPTVITSVSVGIVAVVLIVIVIINQIGGGTNVTSLKPVPQAILTAVEQPSGTVVDTVGTGGQSGSLVKLPDSALLNDSAGKPMIVYVGAEYCPFCAAERWVMVMWLSRFGTFHNLSEIQSSSTDVYPNTDSFTFYKSSYKSSYIDFSPVEVQDRSQNTLETPTSLQTSAFTKWGKPPYTTDTGGFPFVDIGGLYDLFATSYSPGDLTGLSWGVIASKLSNPADPVTKDIVGNANILTAATCIATGDQPASACSSSTIQNIEATLRTFKVPTS